jgi:hypothetical protein
VDLNGSAADDEITEALDRRPAQLEAETFVKREGFLEIPARQDRDGVFVHGRGTLLRDGEDVPRSDHPSRVMPEPVTAT